MKTFPVLYTGKKKGRGVMGTLRRLGRSLSRDREGAAAQHQEQEFGSSSDIAPPTQGRDSPKICNFFIERSHQLWFKVKIKYIVYARSWESSLTQRVLNDL
jgi:hypothetical protein